jgi:hypothetical protein
MALLSLDQILSPLRRTSTGGITMSGSFNVTGSSIFIQSNPTKPAISISGSGYVVDSPGVITGSFNVDNYDTFGDQASPTTEDLGTF